MSNIELLAEGLSEWGVNVAKSVLPKISVPPTSSIGRMMSGLLGINPATYNIYNELGFIIEPTVKTFVYPMVIKFAGGLPEEKVEELAMAYVAAFKKQASEKGYVNVFGVQLGESAFSGLEAILTEKFK